MNVEFLLGKTLSAVENIDNWEIVFTLDSGQKYRLIHDQDCCESVMVEDITGDLSDLVGSPLTMAEETSNSDDPPTNLGLYHGHEWTFYRLATLKGYVTIRWLGTTDSCYSLAVDFEEVV